MQTYNDILIASLGMTPHVISEAFYYYSVKKPPRFFRSYYFLTTTDAKQLFQETIVRSHILRQLEKDLNLEEGTFHIRDKDFVIFKDLWGERYKDIRTSTASESEMETIFRVFNEVTSIPKSRLTVLIAGGRKSMSVNLGLAMQLFGREQDELIHILAPPPYDRDKLWFYPRDTSDPDQQLDVIQIPFFRLNRYLQGLDLSAPLETIAATQHHLDLHAPIETCVFTGRGFTVDGKNYRMSAAKLKYLRYHARRKLTHCRLPERSTCENCTECFVSQNKLIEEYFQGIEVEYRAMTEHTGTWCHYMEKTRKERLAYRSGGKTAAEIENDLNRQIRQDRSRYNSGLKKAVDHYYFINQLAIVYQRIDGIRYYGIRLNKSAIEFRGGYGD